MRIGDRVGAILSKEDGVVNFIGFGKYAGPHLIDESIPGYVAEVFREAGVRNPKITLDDGNVVYGMECWWSTENEVQKMLDAASKVVIVNIAEQMRDRRKP